MTPRKWIIQPVSLSRLETLDQQRAPATRPGGTLRIEHSIWVSQTVAHHLCTGSSSRDRFLLQSTPRKRSRGGLRRARPASCRRRGQERYNINKQHSLCPRQQQIRE